MNKKLILTSEILVDVDAQERAWTLWCDPALQPPASSTARVCYRCEGKPTQLLELIALDGLQEVEDWVVGRDAFTRSMAPLMRSDWRRQLLEHVEDVKTEDGKMQTEQAPIKLQLRYIEVPLAREREYLAWREETIFDVVRNSSQVASFLAYRTLFSTKPGVVFLSYFRGESELYADNVFRTHRYKAIVDEAGDRFISGGPLGLHTEVFVCD